MADIKQVQIGTTTHDITDAKAVHDTQANYDNLKTQVSSLSYQNEWIGNYTSTSQDPSSAAFKTELTNFVNTTVSRAPRQGDEVTVSNLNSIYIYTNGGWTFFSSNQILTDATSTNAGIVKIGSGINVNNGVISATASSVGARPSNWMPTADEVGARPSTWTPSKSDIGLENVENKSSATIRGEITSANVTGALGYTPYNATNPNGYVTASGAASAAPVQSVNGSTGAVSVNAVPAGGSTGQVLTKNASGYAWADAAGGGTKIVVSATEPSGLSNRDFWYQVV